MNMQSKEEAAKDRRYVTALARGLEILGCFKPEEVSLGNRQISERTGLPKATVSRLTYTLTQLGYLAPCQKAGKYRLGPALMEWGYSLVARSRVRRLARPLMQALAEYSQGAVNLGVRQGASMVYVDTYRSVASFTIQLDLGSQLPLATSAMGRACLAAMDEEERLELIPQVCPEDMPERERVLEGIEEAVADFKARGCCFSFGAWRNEVNAVAVPLKTADSGLMAFTCGGPSFIFQPNKVMEDFAPRLINLVGNVKSALAE